MSDWEEHMESSDVLGEIDRDAMHDIIGVAGAPSVVVQPPPLPPPLPEETAPEPPPPPPPAAPPEDESDSSASTKVSRELKSILALAKEAKLDTNISHKRKTLDGKPAGSPPPVEEGTSSKKPEAMKPFPVTAEYEIELTDEDRPLSKVKRKRDSSTGSIDTPPGGGLGPDDKKPRKTFTHDLTMFKENKDVFCWRCHRDQVNLACETCPRAFHQKCLKQSFIDPDHWPCPECVAILKAESTQTRSEAMKGMTLEHLCSLLKFAVNRMIQCTGSEPFVNPVNEDEFPDYKKYIIQPMDLTQLDVNIKNNLYGSPQAFEADAKWILHNSIIFNSYQSKLTTAAKGILKICKQEMAEIENCPSCYLNANTKKKSWFIEVCPKPHLLVWAKLKGFPYWPAKAMSTNSAGMVDVRFFGAHDRAWVHYKDCYVYTPKDPNSYNKKRYDIENCVKELDAYVENLRKTFGEVVFPPYKTPYDPYKFKKTLKRFLPNYNKVKEANNGDQNDVTLERDECNNDDFDNKSNCNESFCTDDDSKSELELRKKNLNESEHNTFSGKLNAESKETKRRNSDTSLRSETSMLESESPEVPLKTVEVTSPSKLVITDKLIKRLSDAEENAVPTKGARKELVDPDYTDSSHSWSSNTTDWEEEEEEEDSRDSSDVIKKKVEKSKEAAEEKAEEKEVKNDASKEKSSKDEEKKADLVVETDTSKKEVPSKKEEPIKKKEDVDKKKVETSKTDKKKPSKVLSPILSQNNGEVVPDKINKTEDKPAVKEPEVTRIKTTELDRIMATEANNKKRKAEEVEEGENNPPKKNIKVINIDRVIDPSILKEVQEKSSLGGGGSSRSSFSSETTENSNDFPSKKKQLVKPQLQVGVKRKAIIINNDGDSVEIKSEQESEEEMSDSEDLEAKRQYLSALNISEKQIVETKISKLNAIRTRSKTEERKLQPPKPLEKPTKQTVEDNRKKKVPVLIQPKGTPPQPAKKIELSEIAVRNYNNLVKQRARKTFPTPKYDKSVVISNGSPISYDRIGKGQTKISPPITSITPINTTSLSTSTAKPLSAPLPALEPIRSGGLLFLTQSPNPEVVLLPQNYNSNTSIFTMVPPLISTSTTSNTPTLSVASSLPSKSVQEIVAQERTETPPQPNQLLDSILRHPPPSQAESSTTEGDGDLQELPVLQAMLPRTVSKAVSDLLCKPMPKLKPRPPGALSNHFEEAVPSSAGAASSKVNSVAHRLSDYFRGMLIETLNDLGRSNMPEATIAALKLEIEQMKQKHMAEMAEMNKNVTTILKDIDISVAEERTRLVDQTRASCEAEAIKRIEETKSKQWCANCLKEAQFYCCWNTSYCDYPCQQKHWSKHMSKCTQHSNSGTSTPSPMRQPTQPLVLRPAAPPSNKQGFNKLQRVYGKPTKVYMNRMANSGAAPKNAQPPFKSTGSQQQLTIKEASPGNFELVSNGPVAGKLLPARTSAPKLLTADKTSQDTTPKKSLLVTNLISDEESD